MGEGEGGQEAQRQAHAAAWRTVAARISSELIRTAPADPTGLVGRYLLGPLLGPVGRRPWHCHPAIGKNACMACR